MIERDLTTFEVARELGVSVRTVQQWVEKGILIGRKTPGGHRRIGAEEFRAFVQSRKQKNGEAGMCRMLVIEDDPDICRLYELMCARWSFKVDIRFAGDGLRGLIEFGAFKPDFTIVDLNIPMIDGYKLIHALAAREPDYILNICVVTASDVDVVVASGELPKEVPVMGKPVDFGRLEQLVSAGFTRLHSEAEGVS
jgi:excisionase family DNA binding protein